MRSLLLRVSLLCVFASACGGDKKAPPGTDLSDSSAADAGPDAEAVKLCQADEDCSDGAFCTGVERCLPSAVNADANGCVKQAGPCNSGDACDEQFDRCIPCSKNSDVDQDGVAAIACGGEDCDDNDKQRFPGNTEVCDDGHDEDCNPQTIGQRDLDQDGHTDVRCSNQGGAAGDDCNDANASVHRDATETCDGIDNNCDGQVDEGTTLATYYPDKDFDEHGDQVTLPDGGTAEGEAIKACQNEPGLAERSDDCDPDNRFINDGQPEFCDGLDNDCNGLVDDHPGPVPWYPDADCDGYGDSKVDPLYNCKQPDNTPDMCWTLFRGDCADNDATVNPAAREECDGKDNNCNGKADFKRNGNFEDDDGDGYPDAACAPDGVASDCNDLDLTVHDGAPELCDGVDNDCDGQVDANAAPVKWYLDADKDGYGKDDGSIDSCQIQAGRVLKGGDCADSDPNRHPGMLDDCASTIGRDDDCDGQVDEDAAPAPWYYDSDGDGVGADEHPTYACAAPESFVAQVGDCAPNDENIFPGQTENCSDSIDNDCDTLSDCDDLDCAHEPACNVSAQLTLISGDQQSAKVGAAFAQPVRVRLLDLAHSPRAGVYVTLTSSGGSGASPSNVKTDPDGYATFVVRAGRYVGHTYVRLSAPGTRPLTVDLTAVEPAAGDLVPLVNAVKILGDGPKDGGSEIGTFARLRDVSAIARGSDGTIYIGDSIGSRVYRLTIEGVLEHIAGNGTNDVADGVDARLTSIQPQGMVVDDVDAQNPRLYVSDARNAGIRAISLRTNIITTLAGGGSAPAPDYGDGAAATAATIVGARNLVLIGRTLYFADSQAQRIRQIDLTSGIIDAFTPIATTGLTFCGCKYGYCALAAAPDGSLFIGAYAMGSDTGSTQTYCANSDTVAIMRVASDRTVRFVAGRLNGARSDGLAASMTGVPESLAMAFDAQGDLYYSGEGRVRRIDVSGGVVTTAIGDGVSAATGDYDSGPRRVTNGAQLAFDGDHLLLADAEFGALRMIWNQGDTTPDVLSAKLISAQNGSANLLSAGSPMSIVISVGDKPLANKLVSFASLTPGGSFTQRQVLTDANGKASSTPILGLQKRDYLFVAQAEDLLGRSSFTPLSIDIAATEPAAGTVLPLINRDRLVGVEQGVPGPAITANIGSPVALTLASDGTLYVLASGASSGTALYRMTPSGEIARLSGDVTSQDGGLLSQTYLGSVAAIALDEARKRLYLADPTFKRVRVVYLTQNPTVDTFYTGIDGLLNLTVDAQGFLYTSSNTNAGNDKALVRIDPNTRTAATVLTPNPSNNSGPLVLGYCFNDCAIAKYDDNNLVLASAMSPMPHNNGTTGMGIALWPIGDSPNLTYLAGQAGAAGMQLGLEGAADSVNLSAMRGLAVHGKDIYFIEPTPSLVRLFSDGSVKTIMGAGSDQSDYVPAASAACNYPTGIAVTPEGHVIVAEGNRWEVRLIW